MLTLASPDEEGEEEEKIEGGGGRGSVSIVDIGEVAGGTTSTVPSAG